MNLNPRRAEQTKISSGALSLVEPPAAQGSTVTASNAKSPAAILSREESAQMFECERAIEKGLDTFVEVGQALARIRDGRLYREQYCNFDQYVRQRWGMSGRHAHRLVEGADIAGTLAETSGPESDQLVSPRNESQLRPLKGLPPNEQREVWKEAVRSAAGGQVTAANVSLARQRIVGAERVVDIDMPRVDGGDIDRANCHEALSATKHLPGLIVSVDRVFEFENRLWVVSVGHFGGSPPDNAVVSHDAHELRLAEVYKGPEEPEFAHGRLVNWKGRVFRLGPKVVFRAQGKTARRLAEERGQPAAKNQPVEFKLETEAVPPKGDMGPNEARLYVDRLIGQLEKLEYLAAEFSTKQRLHLSVALSHLKNFRNSVSQEPQRRAAADAAAQGRMDRDHAVARWKKAKAKPVTTKSDKFIICRTNQTGRKTFDSGKGGWTTDPKKAATFDNATAAKFACRHHYDKPMKLSAALRTCE